MYFYWKTFLIKVIKKDINVNTILQASVPHAGRIKLLILNMPIISIIGPFWRYDNLLELVIV